MPFWMDILLCTMEPHGLTWDNSPEFKGLRGPKEPKEHKGQKGTLEHQDCKGQQEYKGPRDPPDLKVFKDLKAFKDCKALKDFNGKVFTAEPQPTALTMWWKILVPPLCVYRSVLGTPQPTRCTGHYWPHRVLKVQQVPKVRKDQRALKDLKEFKGFRDLTDLMEQ
jgi:hypothetical protein